MEPLYGGFHDATTGETIVRELTADEISQLPAPEKAIATGQNENS